MTCVLLGGCACCFLISATFCTFVVAVVTSTQVWFYCQLFLSCILTLLDLDKIYIKQKRKAKGRVKKNQLWKIPY